MIYIFAGDFLEFILWILLVLEYENLVFYRSIIEFYRWTKFVGWFLFTDWPIPQHTSVDEYVYW